MGSTESLAEGKPYCHVHSRAAEEYLRSSAYGR